MPEKTTPKLLSKTANTSGALCVLDKGHEKPGAGTDHTHQREALLLIWRIQNMNIIIDELRRDHAPSGELAKKPIR